MKEVLEENKKIADRAEELDKKRFLLEKELHYRDEKIEKYKEENGDTVERLKKKVEKYKK